MKKACAIIVSVLLLLTAAPVCGVGAASVDDLTYEIVDGEVTITGCNPAADGELIIPAAIEGCPVTAIGAEAFFRCESLRSVTIPDSVTVIDEYAFYECPWLASVLGGNGITASASMRFTSVPGCRSFHSPPPLPPLATTPFIIAGSCLR